MKDYLFRKNIPVKRLASELKISTSYLYQLIRGERKPSVELAQKIEKYTDGEVTLGKLLGVKEEEAKIYCGSVGSDYEHRVSSLEDANERFEGRLEEIEGRLLKLEKKIGLLLQ